MTRVPSRVQRSAADDTLRSMLFSAAGFDSLAVPGYTSLISSPDVANAVDTIAAIISNATIYLMENAKNGDLRVSGGLARFIDIAPYRLGTRKTWVSWIVSYMLTQGDGNAFVLPVTQNGYLDELAPMPGATCSSATVGSAYTVNYGGRGFAPDEVLHFVYKPDLNQPWRGRGVRIQLREVLQNLKQASATTNSFMTEKFKPSVIVKVDALADEFSSEAGRNKLLEQYIETQQAGKPWVIPADLMEVTTVKPLSLADLAISDTVELDKRAVAAAFGMPAFLLGLGSFDQNEYNAFIRRTILPLASGIAQELTRKLLTSSKMYFKFNERKLYAYDYLTLAKIGDDQYVRGLMTGNEVRDLLDYSPLDGLDELVMLENYIPAGMIGEQKKLKGQEE